MAIKETIVYYFYSIFSISTWKAIFGGIAAVLFSLMGGVETATKALLLLYVLDFVFGVIIACRNNCLESKKVSRGGIKFILYCVAIIVGHQLDIAIYGGVVTFNLLSFKYIIVIYLLIGEAMSLLEHLSYLGVPIPKIIFLKLKQYRDKLEKIEGKIEEKEK